MSLTKLEINPGYVTMNPSHLCLFLYYKNKLAYYLNLGKVGDISLSYCVAYTLPNSTAFYIARINYLLHSTSESIVITLTLYN